MTLRMLLGGFLTIMALLPTASTTSQAAESASGAYIPGLRGPGAGVTPPPGIYFSNQFYIYNGDISGSVPINGFNLQGRAKVGAAVNIPTFLFVTPAEIAGGRLGFSLTVPYGRVSVKGLLGPKYLTDSITTFADPSVGAFLGWKAGDFHFQLAATAFVPIGDYREGELANAAKNRGALDVSGTLTWLEPTWGLDVTNSVGFTFNRKNPATDYRTGTEFHWDWSITKKFENGFSIGPAGYYYKQLSGDSGSGAKLGDFKGEVWAIGGGLGYEFKVGPLPVTARVRYFHEFQTERRLKGNTVFLGISFPLWVPGLTP
jgi:hypothetical protein